MADSLEREPVRPAAKFQRRKDEIVRLAVGVLNVKGVRGMTLADVASQLDLVPTAVSYYFRRKEDLAAACFQLAIARYNEFAACAAVEPTPEAKVRTYFREYADLFRAIYEGRAEPIATFNDVRMLYDPAVNASYTEMFRGVRRLINSPGAPALERRERNARTHLLLSQAFWAAVWLPRYNSRDHARMTDRLSDILANGLSAKRGAWSPKLLDVRTSDAGGGAPTNGAFLRAATELINEKGYLGASVQKIAEVLNVTKGAFYYYNQAKDDLVGQCFDSTLTLMRATQESADAVTDTGLDNIVSVAASLVRNEVSGAAPLLRTSALTAVPEAMRETVIARFDQVSARFTSVISDGIADGSIRPVDANVAAHMLTAMINAGAELHHWAPGLDPDEALLAYVRPLFDGIFAPGLLAQA